jgi:hypothetical protein
VRKSLRNEGTLRAYIRNPSSVIVELFVFSRNEVLCKIELNRKIVAGLDFVYESMHKIEHKF